jgi:hypothetical protein
MSVESELRAKRRGTTAFIAANPSVLILIPTIRTTSASGGKLVSDGLGRDERVFRVIEQASAYGNSPGLLQSADGRQRRVTYQLLGEWDAEIAVGDHWTNAEGVRMEVVELLPYNGYERRGRVVQYG